jgi:transcription elongation factor GreA
MTTLLPISQEGFERIKEELRRLKTTDRQAVITEIAEARALGDLSENAEYHAARDKQGLLEKRINELETMMAKLKVVPPSPKGPTERVVFGTTVRVKDVTGDGASKRGSGEMRYRIVGEYEADSRNMAISISSPLGSSLLNKTTGEFVEVVLPAGVRVYEIVAITFE